MDAPLLVFRAEILKQIVVGKGRRCHRVRDGLRLRTGIVKSRFDLQVPRIAPAETLDHAQRVAMGMTHHVEPGFPGQPGRVDNELIAVKTNLTVSWCSRPGAQMISFEAEGNRTYRPKAITAIRT